jgi:hypothetical protein
MFHPALSADHDLVKYLPDWFPGAGFKQSGRQKRKVLDMVIQKPFEFAKEGMAAGTSEETYVSKLYGNAGVRVTPEEEGRFKDNAGAMYTGGADTVSIGAFTYSEASLSLFSRRPSPQCQPFSLPWWHIQTSRSRLGKRLTG